jgi:hypothetical protein
MVPHTYIAVCVTLVFPLSNATICTNTGVCNHEYNHLHKSNDSTFPHTHFCETIFHTYSYNQLYNSSTSTLFYNHLYTVVFVINNAALHNIPHHLCSHVYTSNISINLRYLSDAKFSIHFYSHL